MEIEEEQMFKNVKDKVLVRLEESIKRTEDYKKWDKFLLRYIGNIENIMHYMKEEQIINYKAALHLLSQQRFKILSFRHQKNQKKCINYLFLI